MDNSDTINGCSMAFLSAAAYCLAQYDGVRDRALAQQVDEMVRNSLDDSVESSQLDETILQKGADSIADAIIADSISVEHVAYRDVTEGDLLTPAITLLTHEHADHGPFFFGAYAGSVAKHIGQPLAQQKKGPLSSLYSLLYDEETTLSRVSRVGSYDSSHQSLLTKLQSGEITISQMSQQEKPQQIDYKRYDITRDAGGLNVVVGHASASAYQRIDFSSVSERENGWLAFSRVKAFKGPEQRPTHSDVFDHLFLSVTAARLTNALWWWYDKSTTLADIGANVPAVLAGRSEPRLRYELRHLTDWLELMDNDRNWLRVDRDYGLSAPFEPSGLSFNTLPPFLATPHVKLNRGAGGRTRYEPSNGASHLEQATKLTTVFKHFPGQRFSESLLIVIPYLPVNLAELSSEAVYHLLYQRCQLGARTYERFPGSVKPLKSSIASESDSIYSARRTYFNTIDREEDDKLSELVTSYVDGVLSEQSTHRLQILLAAYFTRYKMISNLVLTQHGCSWINGNAFAKITKCSVHVYEETRRFADSLILLRNHEGPIDVLVPKVDNFLYTSSDERRKITIKREVPRLSIQDFWAVSSLTALIGQKELVLGVSKQALEDFLLFLCYRLLVASTKNQLAKLVDEPEIFRDKLDSILFKYIS